MVFQTFSELEQLQDVPPEVLKTTLKEYAERGASISSRVVIHLIDRIPLTLADKQSLLCHAQCGETKQKTHFRGEIFENMHSREYQLVSRHLENLILTEQTSD